MTLTITFGTGPLTRVALAVLLGLIAEQAMAQTIQGTAAYRERMALPTGAVFEATLEDVSRADAPAETIAHQRVASPGNPPIGFTIAYDPAKILLDHRYVVRAKILLVDKLLFTTDTATPVITSGNPTTVSLMLRRVGAGQTAAPNPAGSRPLEGTYWKAIELAGKPTPTQDANREAHMLFQAGGRVSGSDGCNQITGSYELNGDVVTFGQMAGTQMACINTGEIERVFRDALKGATRLAIVGDRLELFDATGNRVAAFTARAQTSLPSTSTGLVGTSWQLVKFQGSDGTTLTPDDGAKYTIKFGAGGRLTARIDCNQGRGTWKSNGQNQLLFGPLALTRAQCPAGSLHDQIVKQWGYIRSYVIKDGHLFLSLMADGGIYEFEPKSSDERVSDMQQSLSSTPSTTSAAHVTGTATYRERMVLPPAAVFEAILEDVSKADVPAHVIGRAHIERPGNPPILFEIAYDPSRIDPNHRYAVRARIVVNGKLFFTSDQHYPVLTAGQGSESFDCLGIDEIKSQS